MSSIKKQPAPPLKVFYLSQEYHNKYKTEIEDETKKQLTYIGKYHSTNCSSCSIFTSLLLENPCHILANRAVIVCYQQNDLWLLGQGRLIIDLPNHSAAECYKSYKTERMQPRLERLFPKEINPDPSFRPDSVSIINGMLKNCMRGIAEAYEAHVTKRVDEVDEYQAKIPSVQSRALRGIFDLKRQDLSNVWGDRLRNRTKHLQAILTAPSQATETLVHRLYKDTVCDLETYYASHVRSFDAMQKTIYTSSA